ncbi:MAG: polysaccharide biosynthesis C-terminal domain-containing protein [Chthoniobacterales bacterium]|nr:polysaccharide biosynthesis C-terminal domain-containing protein [Chthoniobacterales bacterium]
MKSPEDENALRTTVELRPHPGTELARGALVNIVALLAANLRGIFTFLIARLLGRTALGTFGLAFSTMDFLSKFGTWGMDTSTIALVAGRQAKGDHGGSHLVLRRAVTFGLLFSVVTALLGIIAFQTIGEKMGQPPELVQTTSLILLALPGIALYRISNGVSRGMKVMKHDIYSRGMTETFSTIAALLIAIAIGLRGLAPAVAVLLGTTAGGLMAFTLARGLFRGIPAVAAEAVAGPMLRFSSPIAIYSLLNILIMRMDVLLLGFLGPTVGVTLATVGIFVASVEISGGMRKVRQAFDPMFTPIIARQSAVKDQAAMEQSFAQLARWVLAAQLPLMGVLCLSGGIGLRIFGPGFEVGALWVGLLAVAHATNSFVGLAETVIMIQRPKLNLINSAITVVLQFGISLVLIPAYGATGAALAMMFAYITQGVLRYFELRFLFAWHWPWQALGRPALAFLLAIAPAIPLRLFIDGWQGELVAGLTFLTGYVGAWKVIGLEEADRVVLRQLLQGRKKRRLQGDNAA